MVFHLSKLRQLVLISQGRGIHVGLDTAEVIQGCLAAVLNMALHQGNGALRVLVQQAVQDIQMLQTGVSICTWFCLLEMMTRVFSSNMRCIISMI